MSITASFQVDQGDFRLKVAFRVPSRGVTAFFGPSGCGKTTLLRTVAGLERDPRGYLAIGDDVWADGSRFLPPHRRAVGYVFQEASLFSHLDVRGNLEYGFRRVVGSERRVAFDEAVALLGLAALLDRQVEHLSGGEGQRVAIARALLTSPKVLLLDEPLTGLDAASKAEILPYLERLHAALDIPVLYVSHAFDEVARLANHLVLMDAGRLVADGPLVEMLHRLDLPLAHAAEAESIIETRVAEHDERFQLTRLAFPSGAFVVARVQRPVGEPVRVRVLARDVSLTLARQSDTSILNILPATIAAVADRDAASVTLRLDLGQAVSMLARVTRKSLEALGLKPGKRVFAQIKSIALFGPSGPAR